MSKHVLENFPYSAFPIFGTFLNMHDFELENYISEISNV
jgi:hypothetical protein